MAPDGQARFVAVFRTSDIGSGWRLRHNASGKAGRRGRGAIGGRCSIEAGQAPRRQGMERRRGDHPSPRRTILRFIRAPHHRIWRYYGLGPAAAVSRRWDRRIRWPAPDAIQGFAPRTSGIEAMIADSARKPDYCRRRAGGKSGANREQRPGAGMPERNRWNQVCRRSAPTVFRSRPHSAFLPSPRFPNPSESRPQPLSAFSERRYTEGGRTGGPHSPCSFHPSSLTASPDFTLGDAAAARYRRRQFSRGLALRRHRRRPTPSSICFRTTTNPNKQRTLLLQFRARFAGASRPG